MDTNKLKQAIKDRISGNPLFEGRKEIGVHSEDGKIIVDLRFNDNRILRVETMEIMMVRYKGNVADLIVMDMVDALSSGDKQ